MPEPRDGTEEIGAAIRATADGVEAPQTLRERIAADRTRRARHARRGWWRPVAALVLLVAAMLVLVLAGPSAPGTPTVEDAARVALSQSTLPAPPVDTGDPRYVRASVGGVRFPNYADDPAWPAAGARSDTLGGRESATVLYASGARRVGYTIVDGRPLEIPDGWGRDEAGGVPVWTSTWDGVAAVVWERGGHTCVLASRTATLAQLLRFIPEGDAT